MITLYTGTPGSGKSLHLIEVILKAMRLKMYVISNFPILFTEKEKLKGWESRFFYWTNEEITVENLINFAIDTEMIERQKESQCLVCIDEAGGRFNCREYGKSDRAEWIDFFSQHRKIGFDFVLVAQNDRMLDRQIRGYIETEKKHRKVNNFGPFFLLPFPFFCSIEWWYTARQRVGAEWFRYRKKVASRYDSMKLFSGFKLSNELLEKIERKRKGLTDKIEHVENEALNVSIGVIYDEQTE